MRVQPPVRIHARVPQQADIVAMRQDPVHELPGELADLLFALGIPEEVLPVLHHRYVGVHPAAVHPHHRLRQKARRQPHPRGHLPANQLVQLYLVRRRHHFRIAVVDLKLRRRHLRVVLLVLKPHRPLHFRAAVDEVPQRIPRQRVVIPARVHILELAGLLIVRSASVPWNMKPSISLAAFSVYPFFSYRLCAYPFSTPRMSAVYGVPSLSITSPNTITLPAPKTSLGPQ